MAADIGTVPPYHNSVGADVQETEHFEEFYDRLFRLQDEVFAGKHPRIKLPDNVVQQFAPRLYETVPAFVTERLARYTVLSNGIATNSITAPAHNGGLQDGPLPSSFIQPPTGQHSPSLKLPTSSIGPALLEQSERLKRERKRIEDALKEAWEQRKRDIGVEDEAALNVSEILEKAWEIVKPISGFRPSMNEGRGGSESFDENSYYSSQANSWSSSEDIESAKHGTMLTGTAAASQVEVAQTDNESRPLSPVPSGTRPSHSSNCQRPEEQTAPVQPIGTRPFTAPQSPDPGELEEDLYTKGPDDVHEEREESEEYSPPSADAFAILPRNDPPTQSANANIHGYSTAARPICRTTSLIPLQMIPI